MAKKILIIEDDADNLNFFSTVLKCGGYCTLEAKNGFEGIELAMKEKPNLILVKIHMPGMDGVEAVRILKSESSTKDIPSIALISHSLEGNKDMFSQLGFVGCIEKPVKLREFIRTIEGYLGNDFIEAAQ